jgi:hypothetical protein
MKNDELIQHLRKIHGELVKIEHPDDDVRSLLVTVHEDIERLEEARSEDEDTTLSERLEHLAAVFEAEHPALAAATRELIVRLSSIGI